MTLSTKLNHLPPLTPLTSADTMRSVQIEASAHPRGGFESVCPLLSLSRHCRDFLCRHPDSAPPTPCLPSLGMVLLATPLAAARQRYYEGSDSCRGHPPRQVSSLTSPCLPDIPTPTTRAVRWSLCQSPQRHRLLPGFATNEQARHSATPNRVRHPTDCRFTSGCSPPRLTATQLPSITEPATGSGTDLHRADKAPSRGALNPASTGLDGAHPGRPSTRSASGGPSLGDRGAARYRARF